MHQQIIFGIIYLQYSLILLRKLTVLKYALCWWFSEARAGLLVNTTPLEAGWTGRLVVEIGNLANLPLRVYVNEGIGQILFFESDEDCATSYEDRGGKYQGQTGLTFAKV